MARKPVSLRSSSSLFSDHSSPLHSLFRHAQHLAALQKLVDLHLPAAAVGHLQVASYEEHALLLIVDSAHRAATLRYRETELIRSLREERQFDGLNQIRFAIRPRYETPKTSKVRNSLSDSAARQIASAAKYIEDEELRKALIKLSRNRPSQQ